jgi:DNA-binding GntR family transcriptional regulator
VQKAALQSKFSSKILEHIHLTRMDAGQHLTEQALADLFRVSRAPIRAALKELEGLGVVHYEQNRGFFLRKASEALAAPEGDPTELGEEPYLAVAADHLAGELPGRVSENELMRRYGLPRGQVIKILSRIAQEGWVERLPGHGWQFLPVLSSRDAYDHSYRFRAAVEAAALLEPTFKVDTTALLASRRQQEAMVAGEIRTLSRTRLFQISSGFHEMLMTWSGNPFFLDAVRRLNRMRRLIEYRVTMDRSRLDQQCREHLEILARLEEGDQIGASRYLAEHIDGARRIKAPNVASKIA